MYKDLTAPSEAVGKTPDIHAPGIRLARVNSHLWRVIDRAGLVRGHLEARADARGVRYGARRYRAAARSFLDVGEFWSADDAVGALLAR